MAPKIAPGAPPTARPSKFTILSNTRALSRAPMHYTTAEVPLTTLVHERVPGTLCIQNVRATAHQTAGATLMRSTDRSPIKTHHLERYTDPEWHAHAYNRSSALHTCLNTHRRIMGSLCTQKMLATAPQIARATLGRATPLAHPNAPSRALYGPGVARPRQRTQKRSTCVLPTRPKASWDSFALKRCLQGVWTNDACLDACKLQPRECHTPYRSLCVSKHRFLRTHSNHTVSKASTLCPVCGKAVPFC